MRLTKRGETVLLILGTLVFLFLMALAGGIEQGTIG